MYKKNNTLLTIILSVVVFLALIAAIFFRTDTSTSQNQIQYTTLDDYTTEYKNENLGMFENTISKADDTTEEESPYNVFISNIEFFDQTELPLYAKLAFSYYAEEFFSASSDAGSWHVTIDENSYKNTEVYHSFDVTVTELPEMRIRCVYFIDDEGYVFKIIQ